MLLALDPIITVTILIVFILIVILIVSIVWSNIHNNKIKKSCFDIFNNIIKERKLDSYILRESDESSYDIYFECRTNIYFVKIVKNLSNHEICVNNRIKWQLSTSLNDSKVKLVEDIEGLMDKKIDFQTKKIVKKIFIIYPNAKLLLRYINECDLNFIYPTTDVYGANIITYQALKENPNLIEGK